MAVFVVPVPCRPELKPSPHLLVLDNPIRTPYLLKCGNASNLWNGIRRICQTCLLSWVDEQFVGRNCEQRNTCPHEKLTYPLTIRHPRSPLLYDLTSWRVFRSLNTVSKDKCFVVVQFLFSLVVRRQLKIIYHVAAKCWRRRLFGGPLWRRCTVHPC